MVQLPTGSKVKVRDLIFQVSNLSNTNGTLTTPNSDIQLYWLGREASIVSFTGSLSAALTTGTLTFKPVIDGSVGPVLAELHTNQQVKFAPFDANEDQKIIRAGQSVGLRYFSSDTVNPTTTDIVCIVEVLETGIEY